MAKFLKHVVVGKMIELGLVPVFYNGDLETAKRIVKACVDGGAEVVEFTNRGTDVRYLTAQDVELHLRFRRRKSWDATSSRSSRVHWLGVQLS